MLEEERTEHLKEKTDILRAAIRELLLQGAVITRLIQSGQQQVFIYLTTVNNFQIRLERSG